MFPELAEIVTVLLSTSNIAIPKPFDTDEPPEKPGSVIVAPLDTSIMLLQSDGCALYEEDLASDGLPVGHGLTVTTPTHVRGLFGIVRLRIPSTFPWIPVPNTREPWFSGGQRGTRAKGATTHRYPSIQTSDVRVHCSLDVPGARRRTRRLWRRYWRGWRRWERRRRWRR